MTWEPYAAGGLVWLVLAGLALPIGQGVASLITLNRWVWPDTGTHTQRSPIVAAIGGLLGGHPGVGLTAAQAHAQPSGAVIFLVIAILEVGLTGAAIAGLVLARRHLGPLMQGMAGRGEVEQVLGVTRLRRTAPLIRPDRHNPIR